MSCLCVSIEAIVLGLPNHVESKDASVKRQSEQKRAYIEGESVP